MRRPEGLLARLISPALNRFARRLADPELPTPPAGVAHRVYIAPANWAGQAQRWARAIEAFVPDSYAVNMATTGNAHDFPADITVSPTVYNFSYEWQEAQLDYVAGFTHVVIEAERSLFGGRFGDAFAEAELLRSRGLKVAMLCHGHDIRLPSRHLATHQWSHYGEPDALFDTFEEEALHNRAGLDALAAPVFVSTPDLLADVPYATWCPLVIDEARWRSDEQVLLRVVPRVVHVPSDPLVKGSALIAPALEALEAQGLIEYVVVSEVGFDDMPRLYGSADIVLDQFRIGSYGAAACEAMAAGRVVVGHIEESVRARVFADTGRELPIVEANPDNIGEVIQTIIAERAKYRAVAQDGRAFVGAVHTGESSARALQATFLR